MTVAAAVGWTVFGIDAVNDRSDRWQKLRRRASSLPGKSQPQHFHQLCAKEAPSTSSIHAKTLTYHLHGVTILHPEYLFSVYSHRRSLFMRVSIYGDGVYLQPFLGMVNGLPASHHAQQYGVLPSRTLFETSVYFYPQTRDLLSTTAWESKVRDRQKARRKTKVRRRQSAASAIANMSEQGN